MRLGGVGGASADGGESLGWADCGSVGLADCGSFDLADAGNDRCVGEPGGVGSDARMRGKSWRARGTAAADDGDDADDRATVDSLAGPTAAVAVFAPALP